MTSVAELLGASPEGIMRRAITEGAQRGLSRIAIYGAGQHTQTVAPAFANSPVEIVGIIDDAPERQGQFMAGLPIFSRQQAIDAGIDAVILSSDAMEDALWRAAAPLREHGITVMRLYASGPGIKENPRGLRVMYFPVFDDAASLSDQWRRLLWHLAPLLGDLEEIVIPVARAGLRPGACPAYLDPSIDGLGSMFKRVVRFVEAPTSKDLRAIAQRSHAIMAWRNDEGTGRTVGGNGQRFTPDAPRVYRVDHDRDRRADTAYLHVSEELNPRAAAALKGSRTKFERFCSTLRGTHGYIFGTGPSLTPAAMSHDFSDGVTIACNSMVKNDELMQHLRPVAITAADPIFHAGSSTYAAEFRRHLARQMHVLGCWLIVPWRDYLFYMTHMEAGLRDRIVGVPFVNANEPNLDLRRRFEVTATSNVFTLFMFPLACTLFDRISVMGCDGRPANENGYFWKHDPKAQIADKMDDVKRAHPSFFAISYDDYYATHCRIMDTWIGAAETAGKSVANLTTSYIPALASRTLEKAGVAS